LAAVNSDVTWHNGLVTKQDRQNLLKQTPFTVWLTGLSASGKSTLAFGLERKLIDAGHACFVLDGDNVRHGLNKNLSFSPVDRSENIRRIAEVAKLMNDAGLIVITAFISPYLEDRALAKEIIGADNFIEVYVNTSIEACESRDPKGLYKKARSGQTSGFTGIDAPYEPPINPNIKIDTSVCSVAESIQKIHALLAAKL
jgi:adenylyl-sulfate kinase